MPKKIIRRYMPDHHTIREHKHLRFFGALLHDPNIWHLNRRSVSGAFAVGLLNAFIPIPFQMVTSAAMAMLMRVNLPIAVGLVWITNPITMGPMFYFCYKLGAWLLGTPEQDFHFELTFEWLAAGLGAIWQPFLFGCFAVGATSSILGYLFIRLLWRLHIVQYVQKRRQRKTEN